MDRERVVEIAIETTDKSLAKIEDRLSAMYVLVETLSNAIVDINEGVELEESETLDGLGPIFFQTGGLIAAMRACIDAACADVGAIGNAFGLDG